MKISAHIETVTEKVKEDGTTYAVTIQGEKAIAGEIVTATLNLSKIPVSALSDVEDKLGIGDIKNAAEGNFPVEIEITTPQTILKVEVKEKKEKKKVKK